MTHPADLVLLDLIDVSFGDDGMVGGAIAVGLADGRRLLIHVEDAARGLLDLEAGRRVVSVDGLVSVEAFGAEGELALAVRAEVDGGYLVGEVRSVQERFDRCLEQVWLDLLGDCAPRPEVSTRLIALLETVAADPDHPAPPSPQRWLGEGQEPRTR